MKTPEQNDEQMLESFFAEMREEDKELNVPPFPKQKKQRRWIMVPLGIAASLLLLMWSKSVRESSPSLEHDVVIITMEEGLDQELKFEIQTAASIDVWESPTSSLLTEF